MIMFYALNKNNVRFPIPNATSWGEAARLADLADAVEIVCCEYELVNRVRRKFEKGVFVDES